MNAVQRRTMECILYSAAYSQWLTEIQHTQRRESRKPGHAPVNLGAALQVQNLERSEGCQVAQPLGRELHAAPAAEAAQVLAPLQNHQGIV